ncbi:di-heme-cytochrome C peroxidase [Teredinibacter haidensis]|uniref:di-heme-cytochrome C peroxidase n=1 Tax=Teredinibacter haidensis TaxID=2731755 RepID=UPI000948B196|nr:di-heme-cytochrome C peroxidase [Teredinibacter haidensis]
MKKIISLKTLFLILVALFIFSALGYLVRWFMAPDDRGAKPAEADFFGDSVSSVIYLDQNWGAYDSLWFYNTTQGSDLIPYDLFLHLEQADNQALFRGEENILRYRYLVQKPSFDNPEGLPLGFVKDRYQGKDYIGFTCAACHTNQLNYQGVGIRIDGGPTLADMEQFLLALERAFNATLQDDAKLQRLSNALFSKTDTQTLTQTRELVTQARDRQKRYNTANQPSHGDQVVHYGYGRLDAFGRIFNRILSHLTPEDHDNFNPASAPVSYPFLWDTPQHDFVQWNGVSQNAKTGALGRNVGEVMGVFGTMNLSHLTKQNGYPSSVDVRNIIRMERHLMKLESPLWPEQLPAIDQAKAERGREVYEQYRCQQCHWDIDRSNPKRTIKAQMASLPYLGTDPQAMMNAVTYAGKSGYFNGMPVNHDEPAGAKFEVESKVLPLVAEAGRGVVTQPDMQKPAAYRGLLRMFDVLVSIMDNPAQTGDRHLNFEPNTNPAEYLLSYKGRPLNGIWATAPYLHNGSVQNLYELFLPQCSEQQIAEGAVEAKDCRSVTFTVGAREFDPINVGYLNRAEEDYPGLFVFDTRLPSNTNAGHEYAAGKTPVINLDKNGNPLRNPDNSYQVDVLPPINDKDRWALVEYLKTL